jgi:hypothetical protein
MLLPLTIPLKLRITVKSSSCSILLLALRLPLQRLKKEYLTTTRIFEQMLQMDFFPR